MTPNEIAKHAEKLRDQHLGMGNYQQIFNDALVLIRELAKLVEQQQKQKNGE